MLPVRSAGLGSATVDRPWPLRFYFIPSCLWTFQSRRNSSEPSTASAVHLRYAVSPRSAGNLTRVPQADTQPSREWNRHATTHPAIDAMAHRRDSDRMAAAFCSGRERSGRSPVNRPLATGAGHSRSEARCGSLRHATGGQPEGAKSTMAKAVTDQGLSVEEYNSILVMAQNNPEVRGKILQRMRPEK
jgi:hypothetical protein